MTIDFVLSSSALRTDNERALKCVILSQDTTSNLIQKLYSDKN
jgi:hypothetical protein